MGTKFAPLVADLFSFCYERDFMFPTIFPIGILGQVWYLIVSIPDLCLYFFLLPRMQRVKMLKINP